ncbi:response regulator transcription factor [Flavobacterium tegetincola]|uniref:response regulator transcription factor n=1 Tax=Flavobacterium tegetincola TaxID=150172 RepID=UPI00040C0EC8|nr:response regulator transcription factor [Flavobacterium tegetincola]
MKNTIDIIDDDVLTVTLLSQFLESNTNLKVRNQFHNCKTALAYYDSSNLPDLILIDYQLKDGTGNTVVSYLRTVSDVLPILLISTHFQDNQIGNVLKMGFNAYLPKGLLPTELMAVINQVLREGYYFSKEQLIYLKSQINDHTPKINLTVKEFFTVRELEIIHLIAQQKTTNEIGALLFLSPKTIEGHKNNIFVKSGVKNTAGLMLYAVENELITIKR